MRDPLAQLADLRLAQIFVQFRLPEEQYLEQLVLLRLEIRKQPDLLQGRDRHALGFLHEHDDLALLAVSLEQVGVERVHHLQSARVPRDRQL